MPDGDYSGRTMAELSDDEKDAISHRARAAAELLRWMDTATRAAPASGSAEVDGG
jgi:inosine/xanthosine triphosphate pyrophosphatase family protein